MNNQLEPVEPLVDYCISQNKHLYNNTYNTVVALRSDYILAEQLEQYWNFAVEISCSVRVTIQTLIGCNALFFIRVL